MFDRTERGNVPSLIIAALFAIGIVGYLVGIRPAPLQGACIELSLSASQEKSALFADLAKRYRDTRPAVAGKCVDVKVSAKASGAAEEALARGWDDQVDGVRPDVWSPASSSWVVLLRQHRASRDSGALVPDDPPALLQSPLVIAMPRPMAEALGWPRAEIGWSDILALAHDPAGWASRGHPEWGEFRLGKTNPNISTSGLHALIGTYFAATGRSTDLSSADLDDPRVLEFVEGVESAVVHYGETVSTFLRHLKAADERGAALSYVSAIAIEEKQVFEYNRGQGGARPSMPLAAVYPKEGTLVADHPYVVLNAPWVTDEKRAAAASFLEFLRSAASQRVFIDAGFRDAQGRPGPEITTALGLIPDDPHVIKPPAPPVLARIQSSWTDHRKRARVLLVLDISGSMAGTKIDLMKSATIHALDQFADDDEVGIWTFDSSSRELAPIAPIGPKRAELKSKVAGLLAGGGTALYATARKSVAYLRESLDRTRINGVVLLTDGRNESGVDNDLDGLLRELRPEDEKRIVRVFTLGYGKDADQETLKKIADASRAAFYDASNPATITKVFSDLVSNF